MPNICPLLQLRFLAKHYRDQEMIQLAEKHPIFGWDRNKGYPTAEHRQAVIHHGRCEQHRRSFILKEEMEIPFPTKGD